MNNNRGERVTACKYCKHESMAYSHHKDELNSDVYTKVAETIPYDDCGFDDAEPMISWCVGPSILDWTDHLPRLCVTACDTDGDELCISIPIRNCPMCGRKLPTCSEVSE